MLDNNTILKHISVFSHVYLSQDVATLPAEFFRHLRESNQRFKMKKEIQDFLLWYFIALLRSFILKKLFIIFYNTNNICLNMFKSTLLKAHFTSPIKCKYWSNNGLTLWLRRANYTGFFLNLQFSMNLGYFLGLPKWVRPWCMQPSLWVIWPCKWDMSMSLHFTDSESLSRVGFKPTPESALRVNQLCSLSVELRSYWLAFMLYFTALLPRALVFLVVESSGLLHCYVPCLQQ